MSELSRKRVGSAAPMKLLGRSLRPQLGSLVLLFGVAAAQTAAALSGPWLVGLAIDTAVGPALSGQYRTLAVLGLALALSAVASGALNRVWVARASRMGQRVVLELRGDLFNSLQRHSVGFHERLGSGRVISRLTADVETVDTLFGTALTGLLQAVLSVIVIAVIMVLLDPFLAVVTLLVLVPLGLLTVWFSVRSASAYRLQQVAVADLTVQLVETLNGIRAVQAFRREAANNNVFGGLSNRCREVGTASVRLGTLFYPGMELLFGLATTVIMVTGGIRVVRADLELGVLAAFILYVTQLFGPILNLTRFFDSLQSAFAGLGRICEVIEAEPEVVEPRRPTRLSPPIRGEVRLAGVRFVYPDVAGNTPVVCDLDFTAEPGQIVAMLGATGAGKSTIAKLIARFYDPDQGAVRLDGVDLRQLSDADLRGTVAMVTQDGFLFSGSVAENILIGRPDATRAEVEAAARALGADEFIRALPDGYDTDVRTRGGRLSAGQRQLVAFARAYLADPAVLILDEATSALDIPTERDIQEGLRNLVRGRTALVIAHRWSTIEIADRVVVVDQGRIVEDGAPATLLANRSPEFAALYRDGRGEGL